MLQSSPIPRRPSEVALHQKFLALICQYAALASATASHASMRVSLAGTCVQSVTRAGSPGCTATTLRDGQLSRQVLPQTDVLARETAIGQASAITLGLHFTHCRSRRVKLAFEGREFLA
jgi:hypothetical protein